jgi:energy-coupling factor transport system ATP-binding protein
VPHEFPGSWSGRLEVDGLDVVAAARPEIAARVGVVFQDPESQIVMDRVEDDVAFGLENRGWPEPAMRAAVPSAIRDAGLGGLERRRPNTLSGGEQQRLALAGTLAPSPAVLVLDEPTANLDPAGAAAFLDRVARLRAERRTTVVLIEHRVELAWPLADRLLVLARDGHPIDAGRPDEVLARSGERLAAAGVWLPSDRRPPVPPAEGSPGPTIIGAESVLYTYDRVRPAVAGIDLAVGAGERVALLGPNGSGKSTLGRLLVGLLRPDAGRVRLDGLDPARLPAPDLARRAGYVFQDPEHQFLARTVREEVELGLRTDERAGVPELMDSLGLPLSSFGERSPYLLSGGEKRRLSLACVLVRRPSVLVLDEPTFGLDRANHDGLVRILGERVAAGTALLAATHDLRFAAELFPRGVVLAGGRVVADGALDVAAEALP